MKIGKHIRKHISSDSIFNDQWKGVIIVSQFKDSYVYSVGGGGGGCMWVSL